MQIICAQTFKGQPELDMAGTLWAFIAKADRLTCVMDGDAFQVASITGTQEVPLVEVGVGLWRNRIALGETIAVYGSRSAENYRTRLKLFNEKPITWLGEDL